MKILKTLLAVALFAFSATTVSAQDVEYKFKPHFYLDLQGGAQYTLGEAKFKKLISPNVQVGLGYQFSPVIGLRLQANGWQSKGGWNGHRLAIGNEPFTADYKYKYVAPGLDLTFNLSNLICGWNPKRVFNVSAFLGGGANIAWDNGEVNDIAAVVKNLNDYNLEMVPGKREGMYKLVKGMLDRGVPVDTVGLQMHINIENPPVSEIEKTIELYGSLGLKVIVTEMEISMYADREQDKGIFEERKEYTPELLTQQADRYAEIFECFKKEARAGILKDVVLWGITDRMSWKNNFPVPGRTDAPLLFDGEGKPKPAFDRLCGE